MKNPSAKEYGIDLDYLRRSKEMTPGARLDWLAAAREFAFAPKKVVPAKAVTKRKTMTKKSKK